MKETVEGEGNVREEGSSDVGERLPEGPSSLTCSDLVNSKEQGSQMVLQSFCLGPEPLVDP